MATVHFCNVRGEPQGDHAAMGRRRRRLSSVVAKHASKRRPFLVSVHRGIVPGSPVVVTDDTVRSRATWKDTLIGADDIVLITYLPLGSGAGGRQAGKQIGMAVGMIALAIAMPYAIGAIGAAGMTAFGTIGALTLTGKLVAAGLTAGIAVGASFLLNKSSKTKDKKTDDSIFGVSGGGNLPRAGERIPRLYGRAWIEPDLTQPAYIVNVGEDQDLYQRMTLTLGYCTVETIKVGDAVMWTRAGGIQPAFAGAQVEFIEPGGGSNLVPAAVISSGSVSSQDLPRPDAVLPWTGPFPLTPVARKAGRVQLDYSLPQGVFSTFTNKDGSNTGPMQWGVEFQYAEADEDDNPISGWSVLYTDGGYDNSTKPLRFTRFVSVDENKRYIVRARNTVADGVPGNPRVTDVTNAVYWDSMRAWLPETIVRPHVTELAIKVRSGKSLGVTAFNAIKIEATARLPVWTGGGWVLQETRKAIDAFSDIMRGTVNGWTYGAGCSDGDLDLARILFYRNTLTTLDTFDGVIRGPMSVYEAAETVLGVIRAQPSRIGNAWSFVRDEARTARKHVITRRQIVKGTSASSFDLSLQDGAADIVVEYMPNGDSARRGEVRRFFGSQTLTPRRFAMAGVTTYEHAHMLATWIAASAYYRRERRSFTTELEGRLMQRGDPALVDAWFMGEGSRAAGVVSRSGYTLNLDTPFDVEPDSYLYVRDRQNREFGPLRVAQGAGPTQVIVNASDVATVAAFYQPPVAWASLWQADDAEMTSVIIGPLVEIAEQYLIQSVEPQGRSRINLEAVIDSNQVWIALGEAPPPQPPVPGVEDILGPTVPVVPWVRADAFQTTTALNMNWAVGAARGGVRYIVEVSYDEWATADLVSDGTATSGTYAIRHVEDQDVYIRAYAVSATGVIGPRVFSSFRTFKPLISSDVASILIQIADLQAQVRHDIQAVADLGAGSIRQALLEIDGKVEHLASDVMTSQAGQAERQSTLFARSGQNHAMIRREEQTRADEVSAVASSLTSLSTTVGAQTATLTTYGTSIDGIKVQYGVVGQIDGVTGGYVMTGMRRLDGSVYFSLGVRGDVIVDGTVYGTKLAAVNLITSAAQIGNLTVDNIHVRNGAISQITGSQGGLSATVGLNIRSGGVVILGWFSGSQGASLPNSAPWGSLNVYRDGILLRSINTNTDAFGAGYFLLQTSTAHIDYPGTGWHEFTVNNTNAAGYGFVNIVVIELSK